MDELKVYIILLLNPHKVLSSIKELHLHISEHCIRLTVNVLYFINLWYCF